MDAMYLNLMFINPRPYTAVVDPPPPPPVQKILDPRLSNSTIYILYIL